MRKTPAHAWLGVLVTGLALIASFAQAPVARAAEGDTPWLGVYMQNLSPELRVGIDYQGSGGVLVTRVVRDGPADRAGIRKGDLIVRVNSRAVESPSELQDVIRNAKVSQTMAVEVFRDGQQRTVSVTLAPRPVDEEMEAPEAPEAPESPNVEPPAPGEARDFIREFNLPDNRMIRIMTSRGRLGVRIESLSPDLGDYFNLKDGKGALVLEVLKDTPAERAGLKAGDVITRAGDRAVNDANDLVSALQGKEGKIALRVVRHGAPRTVEATLERQGATRTGPESYMSPGPMFRQELRRQSSDRAQMKREIDQLRRQLEELQKRLDQQQGGQGND